MAMPKPKSVAEYLGGATKEQRAALMKVRKAIKAAAPKATEGISYGIVAFKLHGRPLIYCGYAKAHCAIYGAGIGTIRFSPAKPLANRVIAKLVKARAARIAAPR